MTDHYYTEQQATASDIRKWQATLRGEVFSFYTDHGVFSKGRVDFGSELLIETFQYPDLPGDIVDVGCGYGPIGLVLAKGDVKRHVHMVDVNERALHLAKENAIQNAIQNVSIYKSNCLHDVQTKNIAAVVTNPPIRAGKKIVHTIYEQAASLIAEGGDLWVVIQKKQGAPSTLKKLRTLFPKVEIVVRKKGYHVIRATTI